MTSSSGSAQIAWTPLLDAGSYTAAASFAGDSLYAAADGSNSVVISRKASALTYSGATNGGPNKTVTLSALLKDATGKTALDAAKAPAPTGPGGAGRGAPGPAERAATVKLLEARLGVAPSAPAAGVPPRETISAR